MNENVYFFCVETADSGPFVNHKSIASFFREAKQKSNLFSPPLTFRFSPNESIQKVNGQIFHEVTKLRKNSEQLARSKILMNDLESLKIIQYRTRKFHRIKQLYFLIHRRCMHPRISRCQCNIDLLKGVLNKTSRVFDSDLSSLLGNICCITADRFIAERKRATQSKREPICSICKRESGDKTLEDMALFNYVRIAREIN